MKGMIFMSTNIIYCFSGTGNCLDFAKNLAKALGDTDIVMMRSQPVVTDATQAKRVGFVFPCHGGGLPVGVEEFMKSVKVSPDAYVFGISQSASYLGTGLYKLNKIHSLSYWKGVTHQCTCIWLFPHTLMLPPTTPKHAQKRSEKLAAKIAKEILAGKVTEKEPPCNPFNSVESKAWPKLAGKKAKKLAVNKETCVSCGQCAKLCPKGNIKFVDGHPTFGNDCIQCLGCLQYCPTESIYMGKKTQKREHYHNPNITPEELMQTVIHID